MTIEEFSLWIDALERMSYSAGSRKERNFYFNWAVQLNTTVVKITDGTVEEVPNEARGGA